MGGGGGVYTSTYTYMDPRVSTEGTKMGSGGESRTCNSILNSCCDLSGH